MQVEKFNVILSHRATMMLANHVRFLAQVSPNAAKNLKSEIISGARSLEILSDRFPWLSHPELPANKYRKMLVAKRYLLIYQVKDNKVFVDYILDCRSQYEWLI